MSYHPDYGTLGTKLSRIIRQYHQELKDNAPKQSSQLTTKEWLSEIQRHQQRTFEKYRRSASILKDEYDQVKRSIENKTQSIFYPKSNSYSEAERQTAFMQRQLAIAQMSTGNLNEKGLLQQIENDFVNNNIDANAERYNYLLTHNNGNLETNIKLIGRLKQGFKARGLDEVDELKRDVETASGEYQELVATFQV